MCVKLSIIIPCYNAAGHIQRCIESLRSQNEKDVEYIFVNDGSVDDTLLHIKQFADSDKRVRWIDQQNHGVSAARNAGMGIAVGEYIFFLDSDDFLEQDACSEMLALVEGTDVDCLIFNSQKFIQNGEERLFACDIVPTIYTTDELISSVNVLPITPVQKLYRTSIIKYQHIRFDENLELGEVFVFFMRFLLFGKMIKVTDLIVYNYVIRSESTIHTINFEKDRLVLRTIDSLCQCVSLKPDIANSLSYRRALVKLIYSFTFSKYVKNGIHSSDALSVVCACVNNPYFHEILREIAFKDRSLYVDRFVSIGILYAPKLCLILFSMLYKWKKVLR